MSSSRPKMINFRISPHEDRLINILVNSEGRSRSELIRESIREYALKRSVYSLDVLAALFKQDESVEVTIYDKK